MQRYLSNSSKNVIIIQDTVQQSAIPLLNTLKGDAIITSWESPEYWRKLGHPNDHVITGDLELVGRMATNATIIIDSLNWLLLRYPVNKVTSWLAGLNAKTILVLYHADLNQQSSSSFILHELLHRLCTGYMAVFNTEKMLFGSTMGQGQQNLVCIVEHRKQRGKMSRDSLFCTIQNNKIDMIQPLETYIDSIRGGKKKVVLDPRTLTTFQLSLTEEQRQARAQVKLPYLEAQEGGVVLDPVSGSEDSSDFDEV